MWSAEDRLKFAVRFANLDLTSQRPGDWLNLKDDLCNFFGYGSAGREIKLGELGGVQAVPLEPPFPQGYTERDFAELQKDVRLIFEPLAQGTIKWPKTARGRVSTETQQRGGFKPVWIKVGLHPVRLYDSDECFLTTRGSTRDSFLFTLAAILTSKPVGQIKNCLECSSLFFRIRKQRYCSEKCTNRAYMRGYRNNGEIKKKEAEKALDRYERKRRSKLGAKTRIQRRARKHQ